MLHPTQTKWHMPWYPNKMQDLEILEKQRHVRDREFKLNR